MRFSHTRNNIPSCTGTSIIRNCFLLGPYSELMPRPLRWSQWGGGFSIANYPCTQDCVSGMEALRSERGTGVPRS